MRKNTNARFWFAIFAVISLISILPIADASVQVLADDQNDETNSHQSSDALTLMNNVKGPSLGGPLGGSDTKNTKDQFGDRAGMLALNEGGGAAKNEGKEKGKKEGKEEEKEENIPREVEFIPNEDGSGKRIIRNGSGKILIELDVDQDGHVTGETHYYPDSGAVKKEIKPSGNMVIEKQYDPPAEGKEKGVERMRRGTDPFGNEKTTYRDSAGRLERAEIKTAEGVKTMTRYNTETKKPIESTSRYPNGNVRETVSHNFDGSGSGTLFGEDGVAVTGRIEVDTELNKTTTFVDAEGNPTGAKIVEDKFGHLKQPETPETTPKNP